MSKDTPNFKPLLAFTVEDTSKLQYSLYASIKLDGIRCVVIDGVVYSRSMKEIRSKAVQELFGRPELNGCDGEILYGDWNAHNVFNLTTQTVMATELKPEFDKSNLWLAVFDHVLTEGDYKTRHVAARSACQNQPQVKVVDQVQINNEQELLDFEKCALDNGYEGVMVRAISGPNSRYKQGRSTAKEGIIGKIKRFLDDEAVILGFEEKLTNTNLAYTNEVGRSQRSQAQEGMVGAGTLGALICECKGIRFTCGSGMDDATRREIWDNKEKYLGQLLKFKYFAIGMVDSYRFPIYLGIRHKDDLS